jgi:hypothetical protein
MQTIVIYLDGNISGDLESRGACLKLLPTSLTEAKRACLPLSRCTERYYQARYSPL